MKKEVLFFRKETKTEFLSYATYRVLEALYLGSVEVVESDEVSIYSINIDKEFSKEEVVVILESFGFEIIS